MKRFAVVTLLCVGCGGGLPFLDTDGGSNTDGGSTDAGSDAGMTFMCDAMASQPGGCAYGEYCNASNRQCRDVAVGTCSNFSSTHSTKQWNVTTSTGPIIYEGIDEAVDRQMDCTMGTPFTVTLKAYMHTGTFPANKSNLPGFFYVTVGGVENDIPMNYLRPEMEFYSVSADMKNATMKFTLCSTVAMNSIQAAFYFTGGNPFCMTLMN